MPDETGMETTRSDAPSADESLVGDAADNTPAAVSEETEQDGQRPADAETNDDGGAAQGQEGATESGEPDTAGEADGSEELKVVVSIKGGISIIGVQQPSSDPHIESFDDHDLPGLSQEIPAVVERAKARREDAPKNPAYVRPAPPARRQRRRQQGTAQDGTVEAAAKQQDHTETLRLF